MGKRRRPPKTDLIMRQQLAAFRKKFGRNPLPGEPVFFDPNEDVPTPLTEEKRRYSADVLFGEPTDSH